QVTAAAGPANVRGGASLSVTWTVQNLGTGRTNANFWYDKDYLSLDRVLTGDDVYLGAVRHTNALDPLAHYDAAASFTPPGHLSGPYYVIVQTDSENQVLEDPLENNNVGAAATATAITPVVPLVPDLVTGSVDAPTAGVSGQTIHLAWTVRNDRDDTGNRYW